MFDFVSPSILLPFNVTFSDINAGYLSRLPARLTGTEGLRYETIVDDAEHSALSRSYDDVLAALVLEHVDWRTAASTMCALTGQKLFVVIQENPANLAVAMTPGPQVPGTMKVFTAIHPELVPRADLESEFERHGLAHHYSANRIVADGKKMLALGFRRE